MKTPYIFFFGAIAASLILAAIFLFGTLTARKPNILILTVDDMSWDSVNALGNPMPGLTPNIDRLIHEGFVFEDAHVPSSVCAPSRQSMITALHPHRNGSIGFVPVPRDVPSLPVLLREAGYQTLTHGKDRDYNFTGTRFCPDLGDLDSTVTTPANARLPPRLFAVSLPVENLSTSASILAILTVLSPAAKRRRKLSKR